MSAIRTPRAGIAALLIPAALWLLPAAAQAAPAAIRAVPAMPTTPPAMRMAPLPHGADVVATRIRVRLNPRGHAWVAREVELLKTGAVTPAQIETDASRAGGGLFIANGPADITELVFLVMMQAAQDSQQDLRDAMNDVEAINKAKRALRDAVDALHSLQRQDAAQIADDIKARLDSMNEMSEEASLRLQMAMDRRSKVMETLSNIMTKMSETDSTIVQNIK